MDAYDDPNIASDLHQFDAAVRPARPDASPRSTRAAAPPCRRPTPAGPARSPWTSNGRTPSRPGPNILLVEANRQLDSPTCSPAVDYAATPARRGGGLDELGRRRVLRRDGLRQPSSRRPAATPASTFVASSRRHRRPRPLTRRPRPTSSSVGGTTLHLDAPGNILSESAWSGSGGGISAYEAQPAYQNGVVTQTHAPRTNPDVAYDADPNTGFPVYDSYNNGTATPVAAVRRHQRRGAAVGRPGRHRRPGPGLAAASAPSTAATQTLPMLYQLPAADFHDVTSGHQHRHAQLLGRRRLRPRHRAAARRSPT